MGETTNKKALIAMSGGVDSSVAALLMRQAGYDCIGVMMKLLDNNGIDFTEKSCCTADAAEDARNVAHSLGMNFYVFNFVDEFRNTVIAPFVHSYESGETPNPCIDCNRTMKFGALFRKATELGCNKIVTGHYARIEQDKHTGRYLLKRAANVAKDQSYFLYCLSQEVLAHTVFPLGEYSSKDEIRELAKQNALPTASKHDSQDICFIPDGDYAKFVRDFSGHDYPVGDFVGFDGTVFGKHKGIIGYTVGQRKGLGIAWSEPLYVCSKNVADNTVTLGTAKQLTCESVTAHSFNWISLEKPPAEPISVLARTRCHGKDVPATVTANEDGTVTVRFSEPQRATSPGQSVVLYDGDIVVGGGIIS